MRNGFMIGLQDPIRIHYKEELEYQMWKRMQSLLQRRPNLTPSQCEILSLMFKDTCFKCLLSLPQIQPLIPIIQPFSIESQTPLFFQNSPGTLIYVLMQGELSLSKQNPLTGQKQILQVKASPCVVGDFFAELHHWTYSGASTSLPALGFTFSLLSFQSLCAKPLSHFTVLKHFLCDFMAQPHSALNRIPLHQTLTQQAFYFGQEIILKDEVGIIYSGECDCTTLDFTFRQCRMDCINLEQYFYQGVDRNVSGRNTVKDIVVNTDIRYKVVTEKVDVICLPFAVVNELPMEMICKMKFIFNCHMYHFTRLKNNSINVSEKQVLKYKHKTTQSVEQVAQLRKQYGMEFGVRLPPCMPKKAIIRAPEPLFSNVYKKQRRQLPYCKPYYLKDWSAYVPKTKRSKGEQMDESYVRQAKRRR